MSDLENDQGPAVTATQVAQNGVFEKFARAGFVASGILHLVIGCLAIRIALARAAPLTSPGPWRRWRRAPAARSSCGSLRSHC